MKDVLDAAWRALAYCFRPGVIGLSLLPLVVGVSLTLLLGWLYWESAVSGVRATLENWFLVDAALRWLENLLGASFRSVLAPLLVVMLALPVIVVTSLLLVALLMGPAMVRLVCERRFPNLEQKQGAGLLLSALWGLGCTCVALVVLVISLPLWFIPPLMLLLPPLIWGWLTYQVMAFDALAQHASRAERRELMRRHRGSLLAMGIVCGYLGAAPGLLWAFSALALIFAPVVIALSIWLYTLVFAFSSLWFTHYGLAALARLRGEPVVDLAGGSPAAAQPAEGGAAATAPAAVVDMPPGMPPAPPPALPPQPLT